ncbi:hypothetical protein SAMN05421493_12826 [Pseudobutyrivibrio sp. 49]|nr:hypothetical protein SAMN05421493_12826 [Pseudobutyrivibrio sp. 49]
MSNLSATRRTASFILKAVVIVSALLGTFLCT